MGVLELYPLDQVSSNCVLKVHQIEAFYFKMFKKIFPGGHTPGPPRAGVPNPRSADRYRAAEVLLPGREIAVSLS